MPAGYLAAEFLESTGTQYIDTKQLPTITTEFELDCYYNTPVSNVIGYTESGQCIFGMRISKSLRGYSWRYMVSNYNINGRGYASFGADRRIASTLAGLNRYRFSYKNSVFSVNEESSVVDISGDAPLEDITLDWSLFLFKGNYVDETYDDPARGRVFKLKIWRDSSLKTNFEPTLDQQGVPCMFDKVSKQPFYNKGTGSFIVGFTLAQARNLSKLPATGGTLTVSLPWEAQLIASGIPAILQAAADKGWTITVQYREPEANNEYYNRYAECATVADMAAVNPNFRTDLTVDGGWIYPLPELTDLSNMAWGGEYTPQMPIKYLDCDAPKVTKTNPGFVHGTQPIWARGDWSGVENGMWMFGADYGGGKLVNVEMVFPKLKDGSAMFTGAILNKESVLRILASIPSMLGVSGFHRMGIGIHIDHQTDEDVIAAIADAEAKGWTMTVQWNGTATAQTASTFGLRKPPVYAKLGTVERPDGTSEQILDWGHYVTNWAENGYQEFASVAEAKEHFNIGD